MTDQLKGARIPKRASAEKVEAVHTEVPPVAAPAAAAPEPAEEEKPLTDEERALAAKELAKVVAPLPPPAKVTRYRVLAGGRAWYRGQQIRFNTGDEFTAETWDPHAIAGFRECGVTIEQLDA